MINEVVFDASSGPNISGTWVNYNTKDIFTVKDCFFQDNQLLIQTTDGRMLDYNFVQDYVRLEKSTPDDIIRIKQEFANTPNSNATNIPKEVAQLINPDDQLVQQNVDANKYNEEYLIPDDIGIGQSNNSSKTNIFKQDSKELTSGDKRIQPSSSIYNRIESEDVLFIKRVLRNIEMPDLQTTVKWDNIPSAKIDTLINLLGVDVDNIVEWIMKDISLDDIKSSIKSSIKQYICGNKTSEPSVVPTPKATSSKPNAVKKVKRITNVTKN